MLASAGFAKRFGTEGVVVADKSGGQSSAKVARRIQDVLLPDVPAFPNTTLEVEPPNKSLTKHQNDSQFPAGLGVDVAAFCSAGFWPNRPPVAPNVGAGVAGFDVEVC